MVKTIKEIRGLVSELEESIPNWYFNARRKLDRIKILLDLLEEEQEK